MDETTIVYKLVGQFGPWGFIGFLLWWMMYKSQPKLVESFREELRQERESFVRLEARMNDWFLKIVNGLDGNLAALRFLIARFTAVNYPDMDMKEPLCPIDGKPCLDRKRMEGACHGTERGGGKPPT